MSQLQPHFEYSPDGILSIMRPAPEDRAGKPGWMRNLVDPIEWEAKRDEAVQELADLDGSTVEESGQGTRVHVEVENALGDTFKQDRPTEKEQQFLDNLQLLSPLNFQFGLAEDRVLTLVRAKDPAVVVGERFQAWLNEDALDENVARECLRALATPFEDQAVVDHKFRYDRSAEFTTASAGTMYDVMCLSDSFGFEKYSRFMGMNFKREGRADWQSFNLGTAGGNCPSVCYDGRRVQEIKIDENTSLYGVSTHETVSPRQSISLILGLGSLAHNAAKAGYDGTLTDTIEWKRPHRYRRPEPTHSL